MIALAASIAALASVGSPVSCAEPRRATIAFSVDSDDGARAMLQTELAKACFALAAVDGGGDEAAMLEEARALNAPWLLVARAPVEKGADAAGSLGGALALPPTRTLHVDVTAFDVA